MFHQVQDAFAVTRINGLFRQVPIFKYKGKLYVKHGSGFAWVQTSGDTSVPHLRVDELELPFEETYNTLGYLCLPEFKTKKGE